MPSLCITGTPPQLVVDAAGLMALGAEDMKTARLHHHVMVLDPFLSGADDLRGLVFVLAEHALLEYARLREIALYHLLLEIGP